MNQKLLFSYLLFSFALLPVLSAQTFTGYNSSNSKIPANRVNCIVVDDENTKWVGTDNGFVSFNNADQPEKWHLYDMPNSADTLLKKVSAIALDNEGNKWIGTYSQGIYIVKLGRDGKYIANYEIPNFQNQNNYITGIAVDKQGKKWIATKEGGVWVLDRNNKWSHYDISNNYELPSNWIRTIAVDNNDVKWIGTDKGLCSTKDGQEWTLYDLMEDVNAISIDQANRICVNMVDRKKNSTLYCDNEIYKFARKANKIFKINDILLSAKGIVWAAGNGIARYQGSDRIVFDQENSEFKATEALCLALDRGGKLWIGTSMQGLYSLDPEATPEIPEVPQVVAEVKEKIEASPLPRFKPQLMAVNVKSSPLKLVTRLKEIKSLSEALLEEAQGVTTGLRPKALTVKIPVVKITKLSPYRPRPTLPDSVLARMEAALNPASQVAEIQGQQMTKGKTIQLEGILFKTNSDELISMEGVERLLNFMIENPKVEIELSGHTDRNPEKSDPEYARISAEYKELSQRRVDAVANFLIRGGVSPTRIATKAYGGERPMVASFHSEKNRRVELKITKLE